MKRINTFLDGIKVVDLSAFLPGPLASLFLVDMGAQVLKIEPPHGDEMTRHGPRDKSGQPLFHAAVNAGKTVCRMDLKNPERRQEFLELIRTTDILIEGFRPGVMTRLGLGYETLRAINPGLIYCAMNGFGAQGPMAQVAGHDANYLALAGLLDRNGSDRPVFFDPPIADVTSSAFATTAILGALFARQRDGLGCAIDLALADVVMPLQLFQVADYGVNRAVPKRNETYLNGGAAYYRVYATADGNHVVIGAVEPKFWRNFCEAAGKPEWAARQTEPLPQTRLIADMDAYFASLTLAEAVARFGQVECCFSPVLDIGEAITSPHHASRGLVRRSPQGALQALFPVLIDGAPPDTRKPMAFAERPTLSDNARSGPGSARS